MKSVAKYNLFKGISTVLTVGTPIITLCSCSELFIHRSDTAISAAGIFTLLLVALFAKDKIMEHFKVPSAFMLSVATFVLILMIESILQPVKYVCIATICTSGIDELSFKRLYKNIESTFPEHYQNNKFVGFMFTTTDKLLGDNNGK